MNSRLIVPLLVLGALAFACGPRLNSGESVATASAIAEPVKPKVKRAARPARLEPTFAVTRAKDGAVRLALRVQNAGDKATELSFPSGKTHDVAVLDASGREVWRWSAGKLFTQAVRTRTVEGGDTVQFDHEWTPANAHGRFTAVATLHSTNFPVERRAEFVLP